MRRINKWSQGVKSLTPEDKEIASLIESVTSAENQDKSHNALDAVLGMDLTKGSTDSTRSGNSPDWLKSMAFGMKLEKKMREFDGPFNDPRAHISTQMHQLDWLSNRQQFLRTYKLLHDVERLLVLPADPGRDWNRIVKPFWISYQQIRPEIRHRFWIWIHFSTLDRTLLVFKLNEFVLQFLPDVAFASELLLYPMHGLDSVDLWTRNSMDTWVDQMTASLANVNARTNTRAKSWTDTIEPKVNWQGATGRKAEILERLKLVGFRP